MDYTYARFTGEAINGFYKVDTTGGGTATAIGELNAIPAVIDTMFHAYKIIRTGTTVTAFVDEVEYLSVTDEALGTAGLVGMGSYNDIALFDNFNAGGEVIISAPENQLDRISLYPNPTQGILYVLVDNSFQKITVSNILGQESLTRYFESPGKIEINTSDLDPGIYFLTVHGNNGLRNTEKFIVK